MWDLLAPQNFHVAALSLLFLAAQKMPFLYCYSMVSTGNKISWNYDFWHFDYDFYFPQICHRMQPPYYLLLYTTYIWICMHVCMYVYSTQPDINIVSVNLYKDKLCKADKFSEPFQTSNMKRFMKTVKNWNPLTIFAEKVWRRHLSGFWICLCFKIQHKGRCWMNIYLIKQKLEIKKLYLLYFNLLRRFQSMEKYQ